MIFRTGRQPLEDSVNAQRETVAVVGSGVAGLTAAHSLATTFDVTLLEFDNRFGGNG